MIKISSERSATGDGMTYSATIADTFEKMVAKDVLDDICHQIATRYVKENYSKISKKLDRGYIVHLSTSSVVAKIADVILKELYDEACKDDKDCSTKE